MTAGRPLLFATVEKLKEQIEVYFSITPQEELTITGLALALNTSRETLMNYEKREEYFDTIKEAKLRVENAYELSLRKNGKAGDIFGLKNFGWKDKQEIEHSGSVPVKDILSEDNEDKPNSNKEED